MREKENLRLKDFRPFFYGMLDYMDRNGYQPTDCTSHSPELGILTVYNAATLFSGMVVIIAGLESLLN